MKKVVFLIFFLAAFFGLTKSALADTNIVRLPGTTHDNTGSVSSGPPAPTNPAYAYDEDINTAFGVPDAYHGGGGDWGWTVTLYSTHTFSKAYNLTQIYYKLYSYSQASGNYPNGYMHQYIDVQYGGGAWTNLWTYDYGAGQITNAITQTGTWNNVTAIRTRIITSAGGDRDGWVGARIYEIQGWGVNYVDIGLRAYDGTGITKIACEPVGTLTSPLRMAKNGIVYGIVLVPVTDANASKIRIQTSSGIEALRKY